MPNQKESGGDRIIAVDALRVIVIFFMIMGHTSPFEDPPLSLGKDLDGATILNQALRFIIPFFFVLAGYFWGAKVRQTGNAWKVSAPMVKGFLLLFVLWSLIYLLPVNLIDSLQYGAAGPLKKFYWNVMFALDHPIRTLAEGTMGHLWFLMAMVCALLISCALVSLHMERTLLALAVVLYFIGVAGGAYSETSIGFMSDLQTRDGPFFGLLPFVLGYHLQKYTPTRAWFYAGSALTLAGFALHFTELNYLADHWGASWVQEYVFSTVLTGLGVALIALSNPPSLRLPRVAALGPLVLGIYCSHYVFVEALWPLERRYGGHEVWDIGFVVIVFVLSLAASHLLGRFKWTRALVMARTLRRKPSRPPTPPGAALPPGFHNSANGPL
ncbi:acyltransferase [Hydrogenophaga sp.]|uniref:acyltransferase n=1 Tax=Hydrogenophaga sp. TaxID=1904254 RepID=UPI00262D447E|nr:acyltransferase [Hydrogenophaga sp.]MCW5655472.1 acyltransferase [Hydrogenophaga sp.]